MSEIAIGLVGLFVISVFVFVQGMYRYSLGGPNPSPVEKAKFRIKISLIGMSVAIVGCAGTFLIS